MKLRLEKRKTQQRKKHKDLSLIRNQRKGEWKKD